MNCTPRLLNPVFIHWVLTNIYQLQNYCCKHRSNVDTPEDLQSENSFDFDHEDVENMNDNSTQIMPTEMHEYAAKWILKTGETRSLTRTATQGVIEDVEHLVDFVAESLERKMRAALQSNGINPDNVTGFNDVFNCSATNPFTGLTSFHSIIGKISTSL